jgi:hypothetical protein
LYVLFGEHYTKFTVAGYQSKVNCTDCVCDVPDATRIEVGFTEEDEIYVDMQPASELEGGLEDSEFNELESIAYTEATHLDKMVAAFAHPIYDYLYSISQHSSFLYDEYSKFKASEKALRDGEDRRKAYHAEHAHTRKDVASSELEFYLKWEQSYAKAKDDPAKQQKLLAELKEREERSASSKGSAAPKPTSEELAAYGDLITRMMSNTRATILSYNHKQVTAVPSYVKNLRHLQEVSFAYNSLVVIPQELTSLPYLRKLILCGNKLKFMPPLSGLPLLEVLDAHSNELVAFPTDIGHMRCLQTIDLERNKIVAIPEEIAMLSRLDFLNLTRNDVKLIPPQIGNIATLSYLKLAHNPIVNLPAHIYLQGTQASLRYLREYIPEAAHITESSMVSDLAKWMNTELFSDLVIRCKSGKTYFAHRIMIDSRCPVLYKQILDLEAELRDVAQVSDALQASTIDAGFSAIVAAVNAASASPQGVPTSLAPIKQHLDLQNRLVLDLEETDDHVEYLLTFIYGDVFNPPKPELVDATPDMNAAEVEDLQKLNQMQMAAFARTCYAVADLGDKYCLPRLTSLAKQLVQPSTKVPPTTYFKDFDRFTLKPKHSDVSFLVDGRTIMTHKILLCARSEYFRNMLTGGLLESTLEIIPFSDVSYNVLRSILQFCYTDDLSCTADTVMDLLMSSRVYGIERLKGMVETVVGYSLDVHNAPGILSIAALYSFKRLSKACKYFILSNWTTVTATDDWAELDPALIDKLTLKAKNWKIVQ